MTAEWVAIGLTAAGLLITILKNSTAKAASEARLDEKLSFMKGEIIQLQQVAQTPLEREALAEVLETKFVSHEKLDDERFMRLHQMLDDKMEKILRALEKRS